MIAIELAAIDFSISQRVRQHLEQKFGSLDRYLPDLERCSITIHPEPEHRHRVDVQLHRTRGALLALHARAETIYAALDLAARTARNRCQRLHRRLIEHPA